MLSASNEADTSERPDTWETGVTVSCGSEAGAGLEGEAGFAASLRHVLIVEGVAVLTPILTREIKFKIVLHLALMPSCRGNYVPPGFKPTCSRPRPCGNYWPLGPDQQRINKITISRAHPGMPINVMQLRSGDDRGHKTH